MGTERVPIGTRCEGCPIEHIIASGATVLFKREENRTGLDPPMLLRRMVAGDGDGEDTTIDVGAECDVSTERRVDGVGLLWCRHVVEARNGRKWSQETGEVGW